VVLTKGRRSIHSYCRKNKTLFKVGIARKRVLEQVSWETKGEKKGLKIVTQGPPIMEQTEKKSSRGSFGL